MEPSLNWGDFVTGTGTTYKYPSAEFMRSHGITDEAKISKYAGKTIQNATTPTQVIGAMLINLKSEDTAKLFSDFPDFNPAYAYAGPRDKKRADQRDYLKSIFDSWKVSGDLGKVDASVFANRNTVQTQADLIVKGQQLLANATATAGEKQGALGVMESRLQQMGLSSLLPVVKKLVYGSPSVTDPNQLMKAIRTTSQYKDVFSGLSAYNSAVDNRGNLKHPEQMSESEYLQLAAAFRETARTFGLQDSFFTNKEIGKLIAGGVNRAEFNRRLMNGYMVAQTAMEADPATYKYLQEQGVNFSDLLHYYLDPTKGEKIITDKATNAQLRGYADNVGVRNFTEAMANELTQRARSNINPDGTYTTATEQAALREAGAASMLTGATPGSGAPTVSTEQLIGSKIAGFGNTDMASAQQAIEQASQAQTAPFRKGGGYTATQEGVTGMGQV